MFEIFLYVDDSDPYDHPDASITNLRVIQDTVKKGGLRFRLQNPLDTAKVEKKIESKDAFRR